MGNSPVQERLVGIKVVRHSHQQRLPVLGKIVPEKGSRGHADTINADHTAGDDHLSVALPVAHVVVEGSIPRALQANRTGEPLVDEAGSEALNAGHLSRGLHCRRPGICTSFVVEYDCSVTLHGILDPVEEIMVSRGEIVVFI